MRRSLSLPTAGLAGALALGCALTACGDHPSPVEPASAAAPLPLAAAQGRPTDLDLTFTIENCGFTMLVELSGKSKTIELPGGRTITTSPGLTATMTNLGNGNQETLVITGAFHQRTLENGNVETVATGRNALLDPTVPGLVGLFLTIGRVSWVVDSDGNLVQPPQGPGWQKRIDVCALLA
jgi:hypothetical protein